MNTTFQESRTHKSMTLAIILSFFLGPLGLFYASITGGLTMTFIIPVAVVALFYLGVVSESVFLLGSSPVMMLTPCAIYWLIAIIWAAISVSNYNKEVDDENQRQFELWNSLQKTNRNPPGMGKQQSTVEGSLSEKVWQGSSSKPNLHEWMRNNPDKSVNDYFAKYGR